VQLQHHGRTFVPWAGIWRVCKLSFVKPVKISEGESITKISRSEFEENLERWSNILIGYVLGDKPFYLHLKACAGRIWKLTCSLEIHSRKNRFSFPLNLAPRMNVLVFYKEDLGFLMVDLSS